MLLISLLKSYANFKDSLLYGRESLTLDEVQATLNSKELNHCSEEKNSTMAKGLNVKGSIEECDFKPRSKSRSKSKFKIKCYLCHKKGHIRRICPKRLKGNTKKRKEQVDVVVAADGYEYADVLTMSNVSSD